MLNFMAKNIAVAAVGYAVEQGLNAFKASRAARRAGRIKGTTTSFTAAGDVPEATDEAILAPFRVTVAMGFNDGSVGCAVHEIWASDSNTAHAWALRHYAHIEGEHPRIMTEAL